MNLPDFLIDRDGEIDVIGHRVGLYGLTAAFREGLSIEDVRSEYPTLSRDLIAQVLAFYLANQSEVDAYCDSYRDDLDAWEAESDKGATGPSRAELMHRAVVRRTRGRVIDGDPIPARREPSRRASLFRTLGTRHG